MVLCAACHARKLRGRDLGEEDGEVGEGEGGEAVFEAGEDGWVALASEGSEDDSVARCFFCCLYCLSEIKRY